jgi:hypothetical protein
MKMQSRVGFSYSEKVNLLHYNHVLRKYGGGVQNMNKRDDDLEGRVEQLEDTQKQHSVRLTKVEGTVGWLAGLFSGFMNILGVAVGHLSNWLKKNSKGGNGE